MFGFKAKGQGLLGIDITSATVKLIELNRQGSRFGVESYAVRPVPEGAVVERRIRDMDEVVMTLKRAIDHASPRTTRAVVALPTSAAITKIIQLPMSFSDDDIEARIALDSDKHIPYPFSEVALDFQRLGPHHRYPDQQDIMLVACRLQDVELLTTAVTEAGLTPVAVDVEGFAMERAYRALLPASLTLEQLEKTTDALLDCGASMTSFHAVTGGRIVHTRDSVMGGRQLTDEIRQTYRLTLEEAGIAKKRGDRERYEERLLAPFRTSLVQQALRSLQLYYSAAGAREIRRLILCGGTSMLDGFVQQLARESGLDVVLADPFADMTLSKRIDVTALSRDAPAMMTACGLALKEIAS
ncbi:type IV pilus assembly protein PilM [Larsenimonas rhizosphaerae]|uniref:type IV pilus assembly protein PilM n=1 Tax=Larsenimonas rhizosphaerae TaxID=2944682 RepID=UPI0020334444|nr:pilus assembly protein PilM [Larsenimonas rhizosphaerae]